MTSPIAPARAGLLDLGLSESQKDALWERAKLYATNRAAPMFVNGREREIYEMRTALAQFEQLTGSTVSEDALRLHRTYGAQQ